MTGQFATVLGKFRERSNSGAFDEGALELEVLKLLGKRQLCDSELGPYGIEPAPHRFPAFSGSPKCAGVRTDFTAVAMVLSSKVAFTALPRLS
jgi:hypothetical protein